LFGRFLNLRPFVLKVSYLKKHTGRALHLANDRLGYTLGDLRIPSDGFSTKHLVTLAPAK
jgi:hypothetical protein